MSDPLTEMIRAMQRRLAAATDVIRERSSFGIDDPQSDAELLVQQLLADPAFVRAISAPKFGID